LHSTRAEEGGVEIHWRNLEGLAREARESIEERLRRLDEGHGDLIKLWLTGATTPHHRHGAKEVSLRCQVRGRELVAARTRPDLGQALDEVLDVFERELRRLRERRTDARSARPAEPELLGVIDRIDAERGHGFILTDGGERVYFHRNAVKGGLDFDALGEGARVGLSLEAGEKGLQASAVRPAPPDAPAP
jgi:cold shock CspA family protein/ribosome-associated translation inhibitor RaiA